MDNWKRWLVYSGDITLRIFMVCMVLRFFISPEKTFNELPKIDMIFLSMCVGIIFGFIKTINKETTT